MPFRRGTYGERPEELVLAFEERQRSCERSLLSILEASTDGILIHRDLRYLYANETALELVGRSREEVIGRSPFELISPRYRLMLAERIMQAYTTPVPMPEVEERLLHASGVEVPIEVVTIPCLFGGRVSTLVHIRDITARRALEIRLRAADRLASAELVAGGIVHEIANPLGTALDDLDTLEAKLASRVPLDDDVRRTLSALRETVRHAARAAEEAKVFTSLGSRPTAVDIHEVLRAAISFLGPELRSRTNVIERFGEQVPKVLARPPRLAEAFLHLLTSAAHALEGCERGPSDVIVSTHAKEGAVVVVEVRDTGTGHGAEAQSTVFEPLLTTDRHAPGLDLALSRELLAKEEGELSVEHRVGSGTTFTVTLKASPRRAAPDAGRAAGRRILVIDDEPRLAKSLKMLLGGHETTLARSGREALERLHAGERYDVVICDLLVEDIDGLDLYRRIGQQWPDLQQRMIFLTGDAFISRTQQFLARVPNQRVQKPFEPDALLDAVDETLARAS